MQHITNQLEYRLIKRRLETGAAGWTEWTEEEEWGALGIDFGVEDGAGELEVEIATTTITAQATTAPKDAPLTFSLAPAWADLTDDDEPLPSAVAIAAKRQSEISPTLSSPVPAPSCGLELSPPPPPPARISKLLQHGPPAASARLAEISPPPPPPPRPWDHNRAQGEKHCGGMENANVHTGGEESGGHAVIHGSSTRNIGGEVKGAGLRPPQSTPTRRSEEWVCLQQSCFPHSVSFSLSVHLL